MEILVLVFVLGLFTWLLRPPLQRKPPKPGDELMKGLKAAYKELQGSSGGGGGDKKGKDSDSPFAAMFIAVVLGLLLTYIL
ncbi:MAG: hypothetical protein ACFBSF_07360 [Leptolyngbyaceae cyanobacterium]